MFAERYARYYDTLNYGKDYKTEIEFIHKWAHKPHSILDLGCGTAKYWRYYPDSCLIFGIEKSSAMVKNSHHPNQIISGDIKTWVKHDPYNLRFDMATALFDVLNYIPENKWWKHIPLKKGGYFIFDIYNPKAVDTEGFRTTHKQTSEVMRTIEPI